LAAQNLDLKARLANRSEPFLFSWMTMPCAQLAGQLARLPLEGVCLDMQHGMIGFSDAAPMIAAISNAGRPAIARVLWNEPGLIGQVLDACGRSYCSDGEQQGEAEAVVRSAKYPPLGGRSWGGYGVSNLWPVSCRLSQAGQCHHPVFAMIETQAALDAVEEIAACRADGLS
jgi:4-hydroxy-2-oxoheptanedioate aldolase